MLVQDSNLIAGDILERRVELPVPEDTLRERFKSWQPLPSKFTRGLLSRISKTMLPVEKGAILQRKFWNKKLSHRPVALGYTFH
jgi:dihydroxyacid dehydratase/phosphogluconate dehydratase